MKDSRLKRHELGFLQAAQMPSAEEITAYYSQQYYQNERGNYRKKYPQYELDFLNLKIAQKAAVVERIRGDQPGSMLDVGCGEGFALAWFKNKGWQVEGIDHSTAGLLAMNPELSDHMEAGDLFELLHQRISDNRQYDLVWLSNVLEHVSDPVRLLMALRRSIAEHGVLVVTVPNDGSAYQERLLEWGCIPERFWIALPDHLAYFDYDSLGKIATATGWHCEEVLADFPIDFFLLHDGSNYVKDRSRGPAAHRARVRLELLLGEMDPQWVNAFYAAMAHVGLGRGLTAFMVPGADA
jgi:SAM-dependent methyltransferase